MASGAFESITLAGRRFTCKADDSPEVMYPGFKNEALVQGDGSVYWKKERHTGHIKSISIHIEDEKDDMEFLQDLQNAMDPFTITATKVDGTVLSGEVQITDEIALKADEQTIELTLEGNIEKL